MTDTNRYTPWTVSADEGDAYCAIEDANGNLIAEVIDPMQAPLLAHAPDIETALVACRNVLERMMYKEPNPSVILEAIRGIDMILRQVQA